MNLVLLESADARVFRAGTPQAEHLLRVLKVSAGSSFWCGVKNGARGIASVSEVSPSGDVAFSVAWEKPADSPRLPPVRLLVGLSRPQTMKKVFAAAAEIGCARIDVFRSEKGDPAYAESSLWRRGDGTLASILEKAAEQSGAIASFAQNALGDMYYNGTGVELSYEKAFQLFSEGKDYPLCKYRMALMLRKGEGVKADPAQANTLLREAADAGNARAQYQLGIDYYAGNYSEQNFKQAVTYLMKALENPTEAMVRDVKGDIYNKLAACYRFGRGVAADEAKADEYNRLAAECGDPDAKKIQEWLNQRK